MPKTLLEEVIERQTTSAVVNTFARAAEGLGEELARELLRDPEFREEFRLLARAAFRKALAHLEADAADRADAP